MARRRNTRRVSGARPARGLARGRHGRAVRSSVAGPYLPMLTGRVPRFEQTVVDTLGYLRSRFPERLDHVRVSIGTMAPDAQHPESGMDRWHVAGPDHLILYRIPIDRLAKLHCSDPVHYRLHVERILLEGIGELLGMDPWDLMPDHDDFE